MTKHAPPPFIASPRPRRILIVGGGVAGLAALRVLVEENGIGAGGPFESVVLFERRDNIGGVWYLDDSVVQKEKACPGGSSFGQWPVDFTKATESHFDEHLNGHAQGRPNGNGQDAGRDTSIKRPVWPSPAYAGLRGNVLPRFLTFAGGPPFPPIADPDDPFPTLAETQDYLELIARPLRRHIKYHIECIEVRELPGGQQDRNQWAVRLRDWNNDSRGDRTEYFDAVVMTVGWTDVPSFPDIIGLEASRSKGLIDHCKWYRGPEAYKKDSRVVVVGNANSGNDIAAQLAGQRAEGQHDPIYRVARHKAWDYIVSLTDPMIVDVPALKSLAVAEDGCKVDVELGDGSVLRSIDRVIFASGYQVAKIDFVHLLSRQPFANEVPLLRPASRTMDDWTFNSLSSLATLWKPLTHSPEGTAFNAIDNPPRIPHLYWQFLHARASTLAFINLCPTRIPFWTSDVQAHCLRAIWDGSMTSFPARLDDRLDYETSRLRLLARLKKEEPDRTRAVLEGQISAGNAPYLPPLHAATPSYHSLGLAIDDYGPPLRRMAISAKPEWERKLPDWDLHAYERVNMHKQRMTALERRREKGINAN